MMRPRGGVIRTFTGPDGVFSVAFSPDGSKVLTGAGPLYSPPRNDRTARLWDAATGTLLRTFSGHTGGVHSVAFSPDGSKVLTGAVSWFPNEVVDTTPKLWDAATGRRSARSPATRVVSTPWPS